MNSTASELDGLIGLEKAKRLVLSLAGSSERAQGVHAILFYGPAGAGKARLAEALARLWLCSRPTALGACGECQACQAFARENNADFLLIAPKGKSNLIGRGAISEGVAGDDDSVPMIRFFRTMPLISRHKVAVVHEAHRMNGPASNSLLKTLEEPFPHARIVLTTESVGSVRATILSRCLAVSCDLPSQDELHAFAGAALPEDELLAEGAPGRLMRILARPEGYRRLVGFARGLRGRSRGEALVAAEELRSIAESLEDSSGARGANVETLDLLATVFARDSGFDPRWTHYTVEAHRRVQGNAAANLVFEALTARILGH